MKFSLTQIVKDGLEDLKRLKPLVEPFIDEWVVVMPPKDKAISWAKKNGIKVVVKDFTQEIEPEIREKMSEWGLDIPEDYRLFNFAAARNASLEAATGDFIIWLDADDEPIGLINVKRYVGDRKADVFNAIYDYEHDEHGNPLSDHWRERVIANNGKFTWKGAKLGLIHETLMPKSEAYNPTVFDIPDDIFRVEHHSDHQNESSVRNHIALLYEYLKTDGEDARTTYYLGIEYFNRRMFDYCIKILLEFVKKSGSIEDRFQAWIKIGEAYHMLNDPDSGRNAYLKAQAEMPNRPDSYLRLGESYHNEEDWARSTDYLLTGLSKSMPKSKHGLDVMNYTFRPAGYLALNYRELGQPDKAHEWFVKALKMNPNDEWVKEFAPHFQSLKDFNDYVKAFVKLGQLSQRLYPRTLSKLAEAVPDELMDQELLMDFKWRYTTPKVWPTNSIVFFCSHAFEDWGPESLTKGCGGSEEAIIQLTKRLASMGWDVTVYNNCIREATVDGVKWVKFERFNPRDVFNILVGWRNNPFTEPKVAAKRYVDMHDVADKTFYSEEALGDAKLLVKSQYHRGIYHELPDEQFVIIPNGIDPEQFTDPKKTRNNLVWTSSYDRGLENLLDMWPDIKKEVPDATLDAYYGFSLYDTTPWGKTAKGQSWKHKMIELLNQDGVTDHGRVGSDVVAEAYKKADVWAYPTSFPEIDCITATKAMAAGCVPITTDYAVMKERNQGVMIEGDINDPRVKQRFKEELIELLKDDARKEEIRSKLDVSNYSWDNIAERWNEEFKS